MRLARLKRLPFVVLYLLRSLAAIAFVLALTRISLADCAPQEQISGVSSSDVYSIRVERAPKAKFTIRQQGNVISVGELDVSGHHVSGFINDAGTFFVLLDAYEGLSAYDLHGQRLARFAADDLLSVREQWTRPGSWACHPEGRWTPENVQLSFLPDGAGISVVTHSGRSMVIDLRSAQIERADPDLVQLAILAMPPIVLLGISWYWRARKQRRLFAQQGDQQNDADRQPPARVFGD